MTIDHTFLGLAQLISVDWSASIRFESIFCAEWLDWKGTISKTPKPTLSPIETPQRRQAHEMVRWIMLWGSQTSLCQCSAVEQ